MNNPRGLLASMEALVLELIAGRRVAFAISLDCNYVGTSAPSQIRCYDISSAILPGTDEMLKLKGRPRLFQVLDCAIDPT